jgi:hypothetical protein
MVKPLLHSPEMRNETMNSIIEFGKFLSGAEKERRVAECDMLTIIHHAGTPDAEVTKELNEIINELPASGFIMMHAHRYENETALLLKKTK